jgi:predicted ATPase
MKIAISGTHSTGKTTFLGALRAEVAPAEPPVISGLAPEARALGFPILKEHNFESTLWMMTTGMKQELEKGLHAPLVFVDRPVMEAYAYLNAALLHRGKALTPAQDQCLFAIARGYMFTYDLVIKTVVDESLPISNSKKRDHDAEFRALVDREIDALYSRLGLHVKLFTVGDQTVLSDTAKMARAGLATCHI